MMAGVAKASAVEISEATKNDEDTREEMDTMVLTND